MCFWKWKGCIFTPNIDHVCGISVLMLQVSQKMSCLNPPRFKRGQPVSMHVSPLQDQCHSSSRSKGKSSFIPLLATVLRVHDLWNIRGVGYTKYLILINVFNSWFSWFVAPHGWDLVRTGSQLKNNVLKLRIKDCLILRVSYCRSNPLIIPFCPPEAPTHQVGRCWWFFF